MYLFFSFIKHIYLYIWDILSCYLYRLVSVPFVCTSPRSQFMSYFLSINSHFLRFFLVHRTPVCRRLKVFQTVYLLLCPRGNFSLTCCLLSSSYHFNLAVCGLFCSLLVHFRKLS